MIDYLRQILTSQYEASLAMLRQCVAACPEDRWEDPIANGTFRWVTYHTLFFTDLYLTRSNEEFTLRDLHFRGGDERGSEACIGLSKDDSLSYIPICRQKMLETIAGETEQTLKGPSGFFWYEITRGEMHVVNIRHIQHHTAQLSAFLRRAVPECRDREALRWIGSGWRQP